MTDTDIHASTIYIYIFAFTYVCKVHVMLVVPSRKTSCPFCDQSSFLAKMRLPHLCALAIIVESNLAIAENCIISVYLQLPRGMCARIKPKLKSKSNFSYPISPCNLFCFNLWHLCTLTTADRKYFANIFYNLCVQN